MKYSTFITILLLLPTVLSGAFLQLSPSAKLAGVSDISAFEESPSSIFYNPAVFKRQLSISSSYFVPFSLSNLSYKNILAGYGYKNINIATGLQELGNEIYKEQTFIMAVNYKITQNFTIGCNYRFLRNEVYTMDNNNTSQFDVGILANVNKYKLFTSFSNINFNKIGNDELPQESRTGIIYQIYNNLKSGICFVKELGHDFSFNFGVSYYPFIAFGILSGFHIEQNNNYFSAGLEFKNFYNIQINYGIKTHEYLNVTHHFTICYQRSK